MRSIDSTFIDDLLTGEPMAAHTTFRVGGPADYYAVPADGEETGLEEFPKHGKPDHDGCSFHWLCRHLLPNLLFILSEAGLLIND